MANRIKPDPIWYAKTARANALIASWPAATGTFPTALATAVTAFQGAAAVDELDRANLREDLADAVLVAATAAVPTIITTLTPAFTTAGTQYTAAVDQLVNVSEAQQDPAVYASALAAVAKIASVDKWLADVATLPAFVDSVPRPERKKTRALFRALRIFEPKENEAEQVIVASAVDTTYPGYGTEFQTPAFKALVPYYFEMARIHVVFKMHSPSDAAALIRTTYAGSFFERPGDDGIISPGYMG